MLPSVRSDEVAYITLVPNPLFPAPMFDIDRLSVPDRDQSWKFARAWTLGEVITALLGADLRLERVSEHPIDWWGGHADARPEERGRIPLSFSIVARGPQPARGPEPAAD